MGTALTDALNSALAIHSLLGLVVLGQVRLRMRARVRGALPLHCSPAAC